MLEDDRAKDLCAEARTALEQLFIRYLSLPGTNVTLTIEDQVHMDLPGRAAIASRSSTIARSSPAKQGGSASALPT